MLYCVLCDCNETLLRTLKRTYFMAAIDGVFCLDARVMYKRETLSVVTLKSSEIMGTLAYNIPNTIG